MRHTCVQCGKKRYSKFLLKLPSWVHSAPTTGSSWICKTCLTEYIGKVNMELTTIIKKLSYLNGQNNKWNNL